MKKIVYLIGLCIAFPSFSLATTESDVKAELLKKDEKGAHAPETHNREPIVLNKGMSHVPQTPQLPELPKIPSRKEIHNQVVKEKIKQLMPLSDDEIRRLKMKIDAGREAVQEPVRGPVKLIHETIPLEIGDTQSPKTIYISAGKVSSFTFLDIKGKPWPIKDIIVGQAKILNVSKPEPHIAFISTLRAYGDLNIAFIMKGIDVPIYFHVKMNMEKAHESLTIAFQNIGPGTEKEQVVTETKVKMVRNAMYEFLDELPSTTKKAEDLAVSGYYNTAWFLNGKMYIRISSGEMISPAYDSYVSSAGGAKVYKLNYSPVLMFYDNGKIYNASVKRPKALDNPQPQQNNESSHDGGLQ